ncbi:hypothetical protein ACHAWT_005009, partial [Skeletonema menzelii]
SIRGFSYKSSRTKYSFTLFLINTATRTLSTSIGSTKQVYWIYKRMKLYQFVTAFITIAAASSEEEGWSTSVGWTGSSSGKSGKSGSSGSGSGSWDGSSSGTWSSSGKSGKS